VISLLEIAERAYNGPRMGEKEWNLTLFRKMQQLIQKFKLTYQGPEKYLEVDDDYVEAVFNAAIAFLSDQGTYCISTNRVIHFNEDEVRTAVKAAPSEIIIGSGRDARRICKRRVEDTRLVNVISGGHCPWPIEYASVTQSAYARVSRGDLIEGFNFTHIDGYEVHGLPLAVYAARRESAIMREAVRMAGRPGMAITLYPILTKAGPLIAPLEPDTGLRRTDGVLLSILPDMKVEADYIATALAYEGYGSYRVNGGCWSIIGGFCGGVEGAMIETIAKAITAWIVYRDVIQYDASVAGSGRLSAWQPTKEGRAHAAPAPLWPTYVIHRALARYSNIIRFGGYGFTSGAGMGGMGSLAELLSIAKGAMLNTLIGSHLRCITPGNPTPYHVVFQVQVSDATVKAKIKRNDVKALLDTIDSEIQKELHGAPPRDFGDYRMLAYKDFNQYFAPMKRLFDYSKQKPSSMLLVSARKASKVLAQVGLDLEAAATR
jgi:methylamine--corrinoid protein Co-methyltransferase